MDRQQVLPNCRTPDSLPVWTGLTSLSISSRGTILGELHEAFGYDRVGGGSGRGAELGSGWEGGPGWPAELRADPRLSCISIPTPTATWPPLRAGQLVLCSLPNPSSIQPHSSCTTALAPTRPTSPRPCASRHRSPTTSKSCSPKREHSLISHADSIDQPDPTYLAKEFSHPRLTG